MLDVFKKDAFGVIPLTLAINKLPYKPGKLGQMGLFGFEGVTGVSVAIEERNGRLRLLPTAARGTMPTGESRDPRKIRTIGIPYIPHNDSIMADDVQGLRAFGEEDAEETLASMTATKLSNMRANHEVTHEYHRIGAIKGVVLDADGATTLYNLFTEFSQSEVTVNFDFTPGTEDMKLKALAVEREVEDALGAAPYDHIEACCGNDFFDAFISHETVRGAFERYQENKFARDAAPRQGFEFAGITWWNYRGAIGSVDFIHTDHCRFFPVGVPDLFKQYAAPAPFMETVNTVGKMVYVKQEPMKFDVGVEFHSNSNPLFICSRPACLIKGLKTS